MRYFPSTFSSITRLIDLGDRSEGIRKKCRRLTLDSDQRRGWKFENLIIIEEIDRNQ